MTVCNFRLSALTVQPRSPVRLVPIVRDRMTGNVQDGRNIPRLHNGIVDAVARDTEQQCTMRNYVALYSHN
jgi:hypothetical protein